MTLDDLRAFERLIRKHYPELRIAFKDESWSQRVLAALLYPFNPYYSTKYATTLAPTIYFPSRQAYTGNPRASVTVLAHEFVHLLDMRDHPVWFRLSYLFPQCLAPLAFLVYGLVAQTQAWPLAVLILGLGVGFLVARLSTVAFFVLAGLAVVTSAALAIWVSGWTSAMVFLVGCLLLAPWPAPGRVHWERRGYAMSLWIYRAIFGHVPQILRHATGRSFYGPSYYYMSWSPSSTLSWVDRTVEEGVPEGVPYRLVADFLAERGHG